MTTMSKTDQEMTDDYCATISAEVALLEQLLSGAVEYGHDDPTVLDMLATMAAQADEELETYAAQVVDYLNAYCLEFKTLGERGGLGTWEVTGHKILRASGGPNCWITDEGGDWVQVAAYWGGTESVQRVYAPSLVAQLGDLDD